MAAAASTTRRSSVNLDPDDQASERDPAVDALDPLTLRVAATRSKKSSASLFPSTRAPISPPPLRRSSGASGRNEAHFSPRAMPWPRLACLPPSAIDDSRSEREPSPILGTDTIMSGPDSPHRTLSTSRTSICSPNSRMVNSTVLTNQKAHDNEWTVAKIAAHLTRFRQDVKDGHSRLAAYAIESTTTTERRIAHGTDLFGRTDLTPASEKSATTMRVKVKQHLRSKRDQREEHHQPVCIKTNKERVPRYRFHHVGIKKNVLTPNTMLTFVPHLRDLESSEETKYNLWLKELEDIDLKSGFKPLNREEKQAMTYQLERAATISLYLEDWLDDLAIPGCNKSALISFMASCEPDDAITPQQKTDILNTHGETDSVASGINTAAQMFTEAFQQVFCDKKPLSKKADLQKVLLLDESVDSIMDSKPTAKDGAGTQNEDEDELAETNLATYCILGCLVCFSHSCDHGEYDNKNLKRTFSISSCSRLSDALKRRRRDTLNGTTKSASPCSARCYRNGIGPVVHYAWSDDGETIPRSTLLLRKPPAQVTQSRPWSDDEEVVLRSIFTTASHSAYKGDAICLAARFLSRACSEVHAKFKSLNLLLPSSAPSEPARVKNLSWYDRRRKVLLGDWQDHTVSHEHQRRETLEPCSHEGPCAPRICSCVDAGLLCDKFCGCTVQDCAYKFTGCACHSQGKTCQQKQKDRPCICVQLNRECDPQLCGSCGALERADPDNADDERLHATGCQNCDLQRGIGKSLILGQSQLDGVGYGLFTAEDIAQDDFIVEYVGELITHDEGVRREARRGDVFDEESNISYVFTLLENEGIWVDAAIYGNLSRYINHASEHDKRGCNITPRILYVNGEYRIKFTAMRDIQTGEELFFNYGENFPNLTKKLLDHKAGGQSAKAKGGRSRRTETADQVPRKAPRPERKRGPGRPRTKRQVEQDDDTQSVEPPDCPPKARKRKRRSQDEIEEAEYCPIAVEETPGEATAARELEDSIVGSSTRLRKRTRGCSSALQPSVEPSNLEPPKKKGKRGGARPGSGRPRKHPRPAPKPAQAPKIEEDAGELEPLQNITPTPQQETASKVKDEVVEIEDSDEAAPRYLDQMFVPASRHGSFGVIGEDVGDEDDDQDVVVRNRNDRAPRTRRPPAKFRDDDIWS